MTSPIQTTSSLLPDPNETSLAKPLIAARSGALAAPVNTAFSAGAAGEANARVNTIGDDLPNELVGTNARDRMEGRGGDDTIKGEGNDDHLYGDDGNDEIDGGAGKDYIYGGAGDDLIDAGDGEDYIRATTGADTIDGGSDDGEGDRVSYFNTVGPIQVDLTAGTASGGYAEGDVLSNVEDISGSHGGDTLTGDGMANSFLGHDGNDTIKTLGGDDYVRGGKGADDLDGGDGARDRISYWSSKAGVTVDFTNNANNAGGEAAGDLLTGFEDISGSKHDDHITTDDNDNRIAGHDGNDTIKAGGGNDFIRGGAGADDIDGGDGDGDIISYFRSAGAVNVALALSGRNTNGDEDDDPTPSTASGGHAEGDTLINIEHLWGASGFSDTLRGNEMDNELRGFSGKDTLRGGQGDDTLEGGNGADELHGGDGKDFASYINSDEGVRVKLNSSGDSTSVGGDEAQGDRLFEIEGVIGSQHGDDLEGYRDDTLFGNDGRDLLRVSAGSNVLDGGDGRDTLSGGSGDDLLIGGADGDYIQGGGGFDIVSYAGSSEGVTAVLGEPVFGGPFNSGGDAFGDSLVDDEGFSDIEGLQGSDHDDQLYGDYIANRLSGGKGADTLKGGGGLDTLIGGEGADVIDGQDGFDIVSYADSDAGVTVDASSGAAQIGGTAEGDILTNIEHIIGSDFDDVLTSPNSGGATAPFVLEGGKGDDQLVSNGRDDTLRGGAGEDTLTLNRPGGVIELFGGADADRFELGDANGNVFIRDFEDDLDLIILDLNDGVTVADVLDAGVELSNGAVNFDLFGLGGEELTVDDITKAALADDLQII
ncbi:calcium-binding protein [Rhodobacteraceae bacterium KMM 6894]|nr:calcium-binding protein [Rhodobacteraceae bacterium KMM 6894]